MAARKLNCNAKFLEAESDFWSYLCVISIPTEPIGSMPRTSALLDALDTIDADDPQLEPLYEAAIKDTIERFEAVGSPMVTDGEQRKYHNFWTYSVHNLSNTAPDGFKIPFAAS